MLCNGVRHRIPLGGGWALNLTFHRWRNLNTKRVSDFLRGAGSSCVKEWGKRRERKSSETQSYLAGWEKGNCWNVAILLQFFSSRQVEKFYIYHPSHPLYAQITEPTCSKNLKGMLESIHPNLFIILMEELRLRGWVTLPSCIIYRTPPGLGPRISTAQCFYTPPKVSAL